MNSRHKPASEDQRRLSGATAWQRKPAPTAEPIAYAIESFLSKREPQFKKAEKVTQAWELLVPMEIRRQCRLAGFSSGILTVEVTTGPLLREMKKQCPRSGIRQIRILPGCVIQE